MALETFDSFVAGGVTCPFNVLNTSPSRKRSVAHSVRHVPGGNFTILQVSGKQESERVFTLYVPEREDGSDPIALFDACLGLTGKLYYAASVMTPLGYVVACLVEYDATAWYESNAQQAVKATFVCDVAAD